MNKLSQLAMLQMKIGFFISRLKVKWSDNFKDFLNISRILKT